MKKKRRQNYALRVVTHLKGASGAATYDISGSVKDYFSNAALSGVSVDFQQSSVSIDSDTTDGSGNYSVSVPAGDYDVVVTKADYTDRTYSVTVSEAATENFFLSSDDLETLLSGDIAEYWRSDTNVTKDMSDLVSAWYDKPNNTRDLSNGTSANQPLYEADSVGGHPTINNVTSDRLIETSCTALSGNVGSIIWGGKIGASGSGSASTIFHWSQSGGTTNGMALRCTSADKIIGLWKPTGSVMLAEYEYGGGAYPTSGDATLFIVTYDSAGVLRLWEGTTLRGVKGGGSGKGTNSFNVVALYQECAGTNFGPDGTKTTDGVTVDTHLDSKKIYALALAYNKRYSQSVPATDPTLLKQIVYEGDSHISSPSATTWPAQLEALGAWPTNILSVNQGAGGAKVSHVAADSPDQVTPYYDGNKLANILIYEIGYNNITTGDDPTTTYNALVSEIAIHRTQGYKVYVSTQHRTNDGYETNRTSFNDLVRAGEGTDFDVMFDFGALPEFDDTDSDVPNNTTYYQGDGVHLTTAGNGVKAAEALRVMQLEGDI